MRFRVSLTRNEGTPQTYVTVVAGSAEAARLEAEQAGYRVADVTQMDGMPPGERWFVGATASVILMDSVIALFVVAAALGGGERTPWVGKTSWQAVAPVTFVMGVTLLLAQGAYAGSRLGRRLDLAWAGLHVLLTLPVIIAIVVGLVGAIARREAAVPWGVLLPVPAMRLGAYAFLGWSLWGSRSTRAFLDEQAKKRVQLITMSSLGLLALVIASLIVLATIPFLAL